MIESYSTMVEKQNRTLQQEKERVEKLLLNIMPKTVYEVLNDIFTAFDRIMEQFGCERIKTMGDAYMAVSGIPEPTPEHAQNIAKVAVLILRYWERRNSAHKISGSAGLASIQIP